jgi:hypothetical protein
MDATQRFLNENRQIQLATLVLAGVLNESQLEAMIAGKEAIPDNWRDIVKQVTAWRTKSLDK